MIRSGNLYYVLHSPDLLCSDYVYPQSKKNIVRWAKYYGLVEWSQEMKAKKTPFCRLNPEHNERWWCGHRGVLSIVIPRSDLGDFTWSWYWDCIVTQRVLDMFLNAGFTGFKQRPVKVERIKSKDEHRRDHCDEFEGEDNRKEILSREKQLPTLWELVITGKGGEAHPDSGIRIIEECDDCGIVIRTKWDHIKHGLIVNEKEWDGTDFFTINGFPQYYIITERVKKMIVEEEFNNCVIVKADRIKDLQI